MPYYDRQGQRIGLFSWSKLMEDRDYRRVAWDEVGQYEVSTVWLGIDHSFGFGVPVTFETMVFDTSDQHYNVITGQMHSEDVYQERYSSEVAALAGHDQAVAWCREQV